MSTITQLINELQTIANAQQGLETVLYADPADVNAFRDKTYPLLLADRNIIIESMGLKSRQRVYVFRLHFYDLYDRASEVTVASEEKQRDIELIAEEFLLELRARYREQGKPWKLENEDMLSGQWEFNRHNDRLIQLTYTLKIRCQGECVAGVFSY